MSNRPGAARFFPAAAVRGQAVGAVARLALAGAAIAAAGCGDLGTRVPRHPVAEVSATSVSFGTVIVAQSATRTLSVGNSGTETLAGTAAVSGAGYDLVSGGGAFSVAPGATRNIVVRFTPNAVGNFPGTLDLGPEAPQIPLSGSGALQAPGARCVVLPEVLDFGPIAVGHAGAASFQVFSVGTDPLIVDVVANALGVQVLAGGGPGQLDPGESRTVALTFNPQAGGLVTGTTVVGPGCPEVSVKGIGTTVSLANDVRPILATYCTCHFFYDPVYGRSYMVDYPSGYPPFPVVKPFRPDSSVLYGKITNSGQFGSSMPLGGALLSAHDQDVFRAWILEGATDN